jgi:UDP-N-acetylmuramate--alanine ligase
LGAGGLITFGIGKGDYCAQNVRVEDGAFHFDLKEPNGHLITNIRTALPGRHNVENAVAACAVTRLAGGSEEALKEGLASFRGIARRFETVLKTDDIVIIDDYAHHPTELEAAISAARELYPNRTIRGVFQPHLFSRTQDFAGGFAKALDLLDEAILIPIYPAREEPIPGVTSRLIFGMMTTANKRLLDDDQMLAATAKLTDGVLLLLGAGNIDALVPKIVATHQNTLTNG